MKRLIFAFTVALVTSLFSQAFGQIIILTDPPIARIEEESNGMISTLNTVTMSKSKFKTTTVTTVVPVNASLEGSDLFVSFDNAIGIVNIQVYNAANQLVDMATVDTATETEVVLSTETLPAGNYTLVISYGVTTLKGLFTL